MSGYEKYEGPINTTPDLNGKCVELVGICRGVVCGSAFLGRKALYCGFLETIPQAELIRFYGSGSSFSTDGDLEASLAKLSSETNRTATIRGKLRNASRADEDFVRYELFIHGIEVEGIKSCFF